jgi:hypothetical protein
MGGGASTIPHYIDKETFRKLSGGTVNDAIFDANSEDGMMTRERLIEISHMRDCFLAYDEGLDIYGRNIVERVQRVNKALKARGLLTWMGEKGTGQQVVQQVCSGIDKSRCMICFVTKGYLNRVASNNPTDNCSLEFNYTLRRKHPHNLIPLVLERDTMDPKKWPGAVGMVLGELKIIDFCDDNNFDAKMDILYQNVVQYSKAAEHFFNPETMVSNSIMSQIDKPREEQQFFQWLARSTNIDESRRIIYCATFVKAGISSVFVLAKLMTSTPNFLQTLGVNDPDADQIAHAVRDLGLGQVPLPDFSSSMTVESVVFAMQKAAKGAEDPRLAELALGCVARVAVSHKIMPSILSDAGMCESILKLMTRNLGHPPSMENGCLAVFNMVNNNPDVSAKFGQLTACDVVPRTIRSHIINPKVVYYGCAAIAVLARRTASCSATPAPRTLWCRP